MDGIMLKHIAVSVFILLPALFPANIFAQKKDAKTQNTFQCMYCKKEVDKSELVVESMFISQSFFPYAKGFQDENGEPLYPLRLCPDCRKLPRCGLCQSPMKGVGAVKEGEYLYCRSCQKNNSDFPVNKNSEAKRIKKEVCQVLESKFKMKILQSITVELDTPENVNRRGCLKGDPSGFYQHPGLVVIENALSEVRFRRVLAHELGHAWCAENKLSFVTSMPDYEDSDMKPLFEGFAEFVSWCFLKSMEADIAKKDTSLEGTVLSEWFDKEASLCAENPNRVYGNGFRKIREVIGDVRTASEWKKIMQKVLEKGVCAYCSNLAETKSPGGDRLCRECLKDTVRSNAEADKTLKDVRRVLSAKFKMATAHPIVCEVGTRKSLKLNVEEGELGCSAKPERKGQQFTVRILTGLPRDAFRMAVAHELAHDWMEENLPHVLRNDIREGFAEYVAWSLSKAEGSRKMTKYIEGKKDLVHGEGFRRMKELLKDTKSASEWKTVLLREYPAK